MIRPKTLRLIAVAPLVILILFPFWLASLFMEDKDDSPRLKRRHRPRHRGTGRSLKLKHHKRG